MSRLLILCPALDHGDASSHLVTLIARAIRDRGERVEILAPIVHPKMRGHGRTARQLPGDLTADDQILLVHSTHSDWPEQVAETPARVHLLYQGLTPPDLCGVPSMAAPLRLAREQLAGFASRISGVMCTSQTVSDELAEITGGKLRGEVITLAIDESLYPVSQGQRQVGDPLRVLWVGRVIPHKRVDEVLSVVACLQRTSERSVALTVVGEIDSCPEHVEALQAWSAENMNPPPQWLGKVPFSELIAQYQSADALLVTSAHEGFCVPLLESMWMGVPIVAVNTPGVVETLGQAGLIATDRHVEGLAGLLEMALTDESLRSRLITIGQERAEHFRCERLMERVQAVWDRWES